MHHPYPLVPAVPPRLPAAELVRSQRRMLDAKAQLHGLARGDQSQQQGTQLGWESRATRGSAGPFPGFKNLSAREISPQEDAWNKLSSDNSYQVVSEEKSRHAQNVLTSNSCGLSERERILCPFLFSSSPSPFSPLRGFYFLALSMQTLGAAAEGQRQSPHPPKGRGWPRQGHQASSSSPP